MLTRTPVRLYVLRRSAIELLPMRYNYRYSYSIALSDGRVVRREGTAPTGQEAMDRAIRESQHMIEKGVEI